MTHLPVVGSSAKLTAFTTFKLEGPVNIPARNPIRSHLWFDGNAKITAGNGTYAEPAANAFSIVQGEDCPFKTPTCSSACYVHNLESAHPDVHATYRHNSKEIRKILDGDFRIAEYWASTVASYIRQSCQGGFRWHVSGDIFSTRYAEWIASIALQSEEVEHWIYTRSFPYMEPLVGIKNLALNLSCDKDNYWLAKNYARAHNLRLCYLTTADGDLPSDLPKGSVIFPDYALRPRQFKTFKESPWWAGLTVDQQRMTCPVDALGKSEAVRCGPCRKCIEVG
jgi:hypothetical protein